ncbi:MAG: four helix bundle protein [Candidatus Pacebacteria bacterium]|nr:four helix bundle protein [Candidatus Paceibacterota bacterium]
MRENIIQQKSFDFALLIIELYKKLIKRNEFVLSKQILRSGTSIGANIEESIGAQSRNDFISKISISYKEARETEYWLKLLLGGKYITQEEFNVYIEGITIILKLLTAIQKTTKENR